MDFLRSLPWQYLAGLAAWLVAGFVALRQLLLWRRAFKANPARRRMVHLGLSVWLLLCLLTLPELWCAFCYDETDSFSQTNVSKRWQSLHVVPNRDGYRDPRPLPRERLPGRTYLHFVGDSFTFGHGVKNVQDRFSDRVAVMLEQQSPSEYEVSNLGLPGLDVRQLTDGILQDSIEDGVPFDEVIYTFVLNDIEYFDERTAAHYQELAKLSPRFPLFSQTYFYNLLWYRMQVFGNPAAAGYYDYLQESYAGPPWDRLCAKLLELRQRCQDQDAKLRIVIFPFLHRLKDDYAFAQAHQKLAQFCNANEIPVIDLLPVLQPQADAGLVVNRFDAHPNPLAHSLAAAAIFKGWYEKRSH